MGQNEILYDQSSLLITFLLFAAMLAANEIAYRTGLRIRRRADNESKSLTGSLQASILGILALLLGFTFSMAMQRYDSRSHALIDEANAIGTAILRVGLLPAEMQNEAESLFQRYVDLRIRISGIDLTRQNERSAYGAEISELQNDLWTLAVNATAVDPRPVTTGAFVQSLNQVIDAEARRTALLKMHVPETVLILLFIAFIASGGIIGYSGGLGGQRVALPTSVAALLIAMVVFIIIDLDRPKRGLIQIDQSSLQALQR